MSQENVEIFKRVVVAWNRDDFDAWIELQDPEVEWFALMEVYRGRAGVRQAWESFKGDMQITVRFGDIRDLGESVLGLGEMKSTGHTTGLNFTGDGRTIRVRDFAGHAEGLEAAGLSE
jgi:ketosteroid isomerase-like protein